MKIEDQVCSLELAKRLKELGVEQNSIFDWVLGDKPDFYLWLMSPYNRNNLKGWKEQYSAFTVAELGELLPNNVNGNVLRFAKGVSDPVWYIKYSTEPDKNDFNFILYSLSDETEVNARAKMLIYILENGLIKNEEK